MKQLVVSLFMVFIAMTVAYQNFSEPEKITSSHERVVLPIVHSSDDVRDAREPAAQACELSEKRAVFLRLADFAPGERVTGQIIDQSSHAVVDVDVVIGREESVGDCQGSDRVPQNVLKVCFPHAIGFYLEASLKGDRHSMVKQFPAAGFCEGGDWKTTSVAEGP